MTCQHCASTVAPKTKGSCLCEEPAKRLKAEIRAYMGPMAELFSPKAKPKTKNNQSKGK